jgi:hypothetical protein
MTATIIKFPQRPLSDLEIAMAIERAYLAMEPINMGDIQDWRKDIQSRREQNESAYIAERNRMFVRSFVWGLVTAGALILATIIALNSSRPRANHGEGFNSHIWRDV